MEGAAILDLADALLQVGHVVGQQVGQRLTDARDLLLQGLCHAKSFMEEIMGFYRRFGELSREIIFGDPEDSPCEMVISKDGGASVPTVNALVYKGNETWAIELTAEEMDANHITLSRAAARSQWEDAPLIIETFGDI